MEIEKVDGRSKAFFWILYVCNDVQRGVLKTTTFWCNSDLQCYAHTNDKRAAHITQANFVVSMFVTALNLAVKVTMWNNVAQQ